MFHSVHFASNLNVKLQNQERKEVPIVVTGEILEDLILEIKDQLSQEVIQDIQPQARQTTRVIPDKIQTTLFQPRVADQEVKLSRGPQMIITEPAWLQGNIPHQLEGIQIRGIIRTMLHLNRSKITVKNVA